ncbi:4488_t:CDS:1 [Paraglomus brasilianum]|uniref:4488_t:CDS:1 n=1 Tax=Paraglomus brasilianum TaxID=144538 RepID=A0A9N9CRW6_9GLOM|nr:4488_t:CDS:1 [Paraglomus brasilianum]
MASIERRKFVAETKMEEFDLMLLTSIPVYSPPRERIEFDYERDALNSRMNVTDREKRNEEVNMVEEETGTEDAQETASITENASEYEYADCVDEYDEESEYECIDEDNVEEDNDDMVANDMDEEDRATDISIEGKHTEYTHAHSPPNKILLNGRHDNIEIHYPGSFHGGTEYIEEHFNEQYTLDDVYPSCFHSRMASSTSAPKSRYFLSNLTRNLPPCPETIPNISYPLHLHPHGALIYSTITNPQLQNIRISFHPLGHVCVSHGREGERREFEYFCADGSYYRICKDGSRVFDSGTGVKWHRPGLSMEKGEERDQRRAGKAVRYITVLESRKKYYNVRGFA